VKTLAALLWFSCPLWAQDPFDIHGYIQGRFTNQEGTPDRLEIRRARLLLSGDPFSQFSYNFQVDVLKKPFLLDASLTWKPSTFVRITAGQLKIPFSGESLLADNLDIPIERARAVNQLAPGRDIGVQGRDVGFQVAGAWSRAKRPLFEYAGGVFRGQTLVEAPTQHFHATAARVLLHPLARWTAGADAYASFSAPPRQEKRRWDAESSYQAGSLTLRAEQIWARDGLLKRRGGYTLGAWRFTEHWEALARADWYTSNTTRVNSTSVIYEAGVNYYYGKHLKLQANAGARHDQGPAGFSSVFLAQTQLAF
jgi:phosphate-selective porin